MFYDGTALTFLLYTYTYVYTCTMVSVLRICIYSRSLWYMYIFAEPSAQGVIEPVNSLRPCLLRPFIPPGTLGPQPGHHRAPTTSGRGSLKPRGVPNWTPRTFKGRRGTPHDLPRAPKDSPVSSQDALGPPEVSPPRTPQVSFKTTSKLEIARQPTIFNVFQSAQGAPRDP